MNIYKSRMCTTCINKKRSNNIVKTQEIDITIMKCNDYVKEQKDNKEYLNKYVNDLKSRKFKNDY